MEVIDKNKGISLDEKKKLINDIMAEFIIVFLKTIPREILSTNDSTKIMYDSVLNSLVIFGKVLGISKEEMSSHVKYIYDTLYPEKNKKESSLN